MSPKVLEAINAQINAELWSAYLYLSMSVDFTDKGLDGFANWMAIQFKEEQDHALKFLTFLQDRGCKPALKAIEGVQTTWDSPLAAFEDTLAHEKKVTALIHNIMQIAVEQRDFAVQSMLAWFIDEQVEEEKTAQGIVDTLKLINGDGMGVYTFDKELGTRTYVPPTAAK